MSYKKIYNKDTSSLSNHELENHICDIKEYRTQKINCYGLSAHKCSILLSIANIEKSNRASSYLAKVSIFIASGIILSLAITIIDKYCIL